MQSLSLQNIHKSFGDTKVLKGIDLEISDGEFVVFVGPSGCGKSTLLRIIAGLEKETSGQIVLGGDVINSVPPAARGISMVFQTYALYPHLNIRDNMSLGLKQAKHSKEEIRSRVNRAADMLSIDTLLERRPSELSGGQRQRTAIGRAIVREPRLFLFDEPLSNLDAALRINTRLEIAKLHRELGTTMIYVTHDQTEAMTLADRIVILNAGKIEQAGTPMELYNNPANRFVAGFIGAPQMNFLENGKLGIRPEHISLDSKSGDLQGTVAHVEHLGSETNVYLDCAGEGTLTIRLTGEHAITSGSKMFAKFKKNSSFSFDANGKRV